MRILFVSAEVAPFAKVGGLADVAGALPKALCRLGHDARVIMPCYRMIEDDPRWTLETKIEHFSVPMGNLGNKLAFLKRTTLDGLPVAFIGTDDWFTEGVDNQTLYQPGEWQHIFFSRAVMIAMELLDWIPDVVHSNDWHTGFLPLLIRELGGPVWEEVATVHTIHNLAYQGEFGIEALDAAGLPHRLFNSEEVEAWGNVNFLKAGCVFADRVNTVSKNYAQEIQTLEFGCKFEGLMEHLGHRGYLSGILNGLDTDVFNPMTDPDLPANFSVDELQGKTECRRYLLDELKMEPIPNAPLFGVVSRLSSQKGMDLILKAAEAMFSLPVQLIVQGQGDLALTESLRGLQERFPKHFRYVPQFAAPIAQRIYAGCDAFMMPSAFEPCGLGQMIAMRYGTVPVVRATGGLADTVFEGINGIVYQNQEPMELLSAVTRARDLYLQPYLWRFTMLNGMRGDYSWDQSASKYLKLYEDARYDRAMLAAKTA